MAKYSFYVFSGQGFPFGLRTGKFTANERKRMNDDVGLSKLPYGSERQYGFLSRLRYVPSHAPLRFRPAVARAGRAHGQPPVRQRDEEEYDDEEEMYDRPRRGGSVFGKIIGGLLIVLLPLLVGLLAWRQYDVLAEALLPLYLTEKAPDWLRSVFYGALTAAAVLLSMLPGLWTILLSRKPPKQD